jgi:hypothetical protein
VISDAQHKRFVAKGKPAEGKTGNGATIHAKKPRKFALNRAETILNQAALAIFISWQQKGRPLGRPLGLAVFADQ